MKKLFLKSVHQLLQAFILVAFLFVAHCIHCRKVTYLFQEVGSRFVHACACVQHLIENDRLFEIRIVPCFYRDKDGAKIARDK